MRRKLVYIFVIAAAFLIILLVIFYKPSSKVVAPGQQSSVQSPNPQEKKVLPKPEFNKQLYAIDKAGSLWWIVNKTRPLEPAAYAPDDLVVPGVPLRNNAGNNETLLRKEAALSLEKMTAAAKQDGLLIMLASGYRSYQLQVSVYNANVQKYGQAGADKQSARPGTSEHQTGLAADLGSTTRQCEIEQCFGNMPEGKWLMANAYKFGFLLRYPDGKQSVTGYENEPWHYRYVGFELATELNKQSVKTLEEFFGIIPDKQPY